MELVIPSFYRMLTTGMLLWIGRKKEDILALSVKPDGTKALSDLRLLTVYHPTHYPEPMDPSLLYVLAYGGPSLGWIDGQPREATVEYRLMKGTQIQAPSGPAAIVADAPMLGDIVEALLVELSQLGKGQPGRSTVYWPNGVLEDDDLERHCRLQRADVSYHPSLTGLDGNALDAIAYRMMCNFTVG